MIATGNNMPMERWATQRTSQAHRPHRSGGTPGHAIQVKAALRAWVADTHGIAEAHEAHHEATQARGSPWPAKDSSKKAKLENTPLPASIVCARPKNNASAFAKGVRRPTR